MKSLDNKKTSHSSFANFCKYFVILLIFIASVKSAKAQVADYTFASSAGTYTSISGTVVASGTWDDANSVLINIPFTFNYNGIDYTSVSINTNGFIVLGAVNASIYDGCGLQNCHFNAIAGYGTDLINGTGTSSVQYSVIGGAPNRQFVAQWTNVQHYSATPDHWTFQIILQETVNTIKVVWGASTDVTTMGANTCVDVATESGNIGLLGDNLADFNIRSITNGTNTWATSVAGAALTDVCNMSSTNIPANGLTYIWTPPVPTAMVYDSSTTVFLRNTQTNPPASGGNRILQVKIKTHGSLTPFTVSQLNFSTAGSDNPGNDIANAKVYFTGISSVFSTATQFGSVVTNPNGAYSVNGSAILGSGMNNFWVTYDITAGATMGDTLRGCCTQITGSAGMGVQVPNVTCPGGYQTVNAQTGWVPVSTLAPHENGGVMLLLSDGTVICKTAAGSDATGDIWDKLTPDINGSYVNGTWSQIAPMIDSRLFFSSQVLQDGRVYVAGGEYGTGNGKSEVYDPLTDTWTACPTTGFNYVDANSAIMPNGHVLQACEWDDKTFDYNPISNTYTNQQNTLGTVDEATWVTLPDSSILMVDMGTTNSERYIPSLGHWITDGNVPVSLYDPYGSETGPGFLLPDGRVFFIGSPPVTAYYTPSGNQSNGTWAAGPAIPNNQGCPDAGGAMMMNGKILVGVSPTATSGDHFPAPTTFYEFDFLTNSWTQLIAPDGTPSLNMSSFVNTFLNLPDGSVLYAAQQQSGTVSFQYYVYKPSGTPLAAGKPTISKVIQTSCSAFSVTGTLFNGIGEGACYGDDWQMSTNFPLVRLTAQNGNVHYARTFNWNRVGVVQTGSLPDTTQFTLPAGLPHGVYNLVVVVNGIASDPVQFIPFPVFSTTTNPPAICTGSTFTYAPATHDFTTTYSWTRAAVAGISNAAITTPQFTNPNEVLVNTTSNPLDVNYQYILTDNGCTDTVLVTVTVNPLPTVSFSGLSSPACVNGGSPQTLTGNPPAGTFTGNGITGNILDPTTLALGTDTITYTYTDGNGCTNSSQQIVNAEICSGIIALANSANNILLYPNPAAGMVTILFTAKGNESYTLILSDMFGRKVAVHNGKAMHGTNNHEFSLSNVAKGIYIIELQMGDAASKVKLAAE